MVRAIGSIGCVMALVTGLVTGQGVIPPDLAAMADTERQFAKTATVKGWRDAFLEFFADDALALGREITAAKDGLRKQPSTPFSEFELVWEPRLGDVAASGDLGWLTGPEHIDQPHVEGTKARPRLLPVDLAETARRQVARLHRRRRRRARTCFLRPGVHAHGLRRAVCRGTRKKKRKRRGRTSPRPTAISMHRLPRRAQAGRLRAACPLRPGSTGPGSRRSSAPRPSRVAQRARVDGHGQGRRRRSGRRWRLRLHLRHV